MDSCIDIKIKARIDFDGKDIDGMSKASAVARDKKALETALTSLGLTVEEITMRVVSHRGKRS